MPRKTTQEAHIALLLPMAVSQGWTVRDFASRARIDTNKAQVLLKDASRQVTADLANVQAVDALALSVEIGGRAVTLGDIQGKLVQGAARSIGRLPSEPDRWSDAQWAGYRRSTQVLRDAKALGLIRFGEPPAPLEGEAERQAARSTLAEYLSADKPKRQRAVSSTDKGEC